MKRRAGGADNNADTQVPFVVTGKPRHCGGAMPGEYSTVHGGNAQLTAAEPGFHCDPCEAGYHAQCYSAGFANPYCPCARRGHAK